MSDARSEFSAKLKAMSLEELKQYHGVTNQFNAVVNFFGVMMIIFMMCFPSVIVIIPGTLLLIFLASTGTNIVKVRAEIKRLIETKDK